MAEEKPTYKDLEQRISFLERELHDKDERLLQLQEKARERERNIQDITSNFETFFNTIDDFLFVLDEQGNIVHCNSTVEKRLGYTLEELKGKSILSVHPEERRREASEVTADVIAGELTSCHIPLVTKQGKQIYVETRANHGVWNGKPAIFGVSKDITKLKLSEEKYSTVFYLTPSACGLSEAISGRYIEVNDAFCKLFGYTREESIGYNAIELQIIPEKTRAEILSKADSLGRIYNIEVELRTKNGDVKRVLLSGENVCIQDKIYRYSIVHDVTEIHKAKQMAEENERRFSMLLNACPEPLSVTTIDDGRFILTNEAFHKASGFEREDILNHNSIELNTWLSIEDRQKWVNELVKNGSIRGAEIQLRTKHGVRDYLISSDIIEFDKKKCSLNFYIDITDRKTAELELLKAKEMAEESESKFKNLYEALSISYLILKDGLCIECNEATLSIYGADSKDEVIGKSPLDFSPEFQLNNLKTSDEIYRQIQATIEKGSHSFEWIAFRNNKREEFFAEISLKKFYYKGELYLQCLTTDITERKRIEAENIAAKNKAEEIQLLLQNITDSMPAFIAAVDAETLEYKFVNNQYATNFGKNKNEIIGSHVSKIIGQKNYEFALEYINKIKQGQPSSYINTFDFIEGRKYASVNYVQGYNEKGEFDKIIVLTYDVTELKNAEFELIKAKEKVEESEHKFSSAFHNNPSIVSITSVNDGKIIEANEATYRITGYKPEDLIGKSPVDLELWTISDDRIKYRDLLSETKRVLNFESTFKKKSGETFIGLISGEVIQLNNQNYVLSIINDITELKNTEFELIKAKEKAEESDHLKTAFLQNVSHEIRTPLNAICGFSEILSNEDLPVDKRKSFVQIIQNSSSQLLSIVNDVLAISSLETKQAKINLSTVCLNTIIVEMLAIFKQQAKNRNIALYTTHQLTDKQSEVYTDKTKITQVLSNLLFNALKFTHTGSIEFGYRLVNNEIEFFVKDTGIGIKPELLEKIFERFRQADSTIQTNYGGTGLGLSICKGFVELLGGKIWAESEIGKGATFYFTLPYKPVDETYNINSSGRQNKDFRTVMVAEDDEYNFLFIEELLIQTEIKLIHAKNGEEAVEIFKTNPQIDLILMDIKMPIMDGYNAAKIIKSAKPDLPIVAQTAYAMEYERIKYEGVFDDYITKPIKGEMLTEMISKFLAVKR
jgi:PAS domain S-box-containing protein